MSQEQYNDSSKGSSTASGSPQSPLHLATGSRGATFPTEGDSMEDDEDAKSESYSWKSHIHRHGKVGVEDILLSAMNFAGKTIHGRSLSTTLRIIIIHDT
jgi:hypothetical protein